MIICVKCGHQNQDALNKCAGCQVALPKISVASGAEPELEYTAERLTELQQAAAKIVSGEWTPDQFIDFLEGMQQYFSESEQAIRALEIPPEAIEDFRDELERGFRGLEFYQDGVACMMQFVDTGDEANLDEGLDLVRTGNDLLNEAMNINRAQRRKFEELYLDSSNVI
jgi:hypothetical protein